MIKKYLTLKNLTKYSFCLLLCCLMALKTTNLLGQASQDIPTQEDITEALNVLKALAQELESASLTKDGKYYSLSLKDSPVMATVGVSIFQTPLPEGTPGRTQQLTAQLEERQQIESQERRRSNNIERRLERSNHVLQQRQYQVSQTDFHDLPSDDMKREIRYRTSKIGRNERRLLGLTRRQARRSLRSDTLKVWENVFSHISQKHSDIEGRVTITYEARNTRFRRDIMIDPQRSFLTVKNPITSTMHSTSFREMMSGQPVNIGQTQQLWPKGEALTQDFQKELAHLSDNSQSGRILRINKFRQSLFRATRRTLLFVGIPYLLFVSDTLKEERSEALTEIAIFLNIPEDIFENGLDGLYSLINDLMSTQPLENNSDNFAFEEK